GREKMYSLGLINAHFWLATIGTVLYIASMWVNGITQGLMWRAVNEDVTLTYYFVPKQAGRPIYSYRLSIVHFWAIISIYIWAGPHHLHYTALPDWA
ncbi:cbb3-type cytochrome c oxidase subunit I, partial [Pseudomonas aeruginosa]|uniref:cbb3-type cytochrome c oxidase subunit I n=1 Tax=Pseudomonas aeruginosa TaxID=287 RepID=UPI001FB91060